MMAHHSSSAFAKSSHHATSVTMPAFAASISMTAQSKPIIPLMDSRACRAASAMISMISITRSLAIGGGAKHRSGSVVTGSLPSAIAEAVRQQSPGLSVKAP